MSTESAIRDSIDEAATTVGSLWPIHSFVTANPLAGFEDQPFGEAVEQAATLLGGRGFPSAQTFGTALERGQIDRVILEEELTEAGYEDDPETLLDRMADAADAVNGDADTAADHVDKVLTKWLSAFLDEGSAHWSMPNREAGFYTAFRGMAEYDSDIPDEGVVADLPEAPIEVIEAVLKSYPESQWVPIFEEQLAALPGWTRFIKQRAEDEGAWQSTYPISLEGYLAARLALLDAVDANIEPSNDVSNTNPADDLAQAFLRAWEATYREDLVGTVAAQSQSMDDSDTSGRPDAQLVFCIDTRSEVIRRHIEATGDYETYGYAGFFGIPMEYQGYDDDVSVDVCPPILDPQHHIIDCPTDDDTQARHDRRSGMRAAAADVIEILEANAATAYGYVETAGSGYGLSLAARTLVPGRVHDLIDAAAELVPDDHEFCEPLVHHQHTYSGDLPVGLTHEEKVAYAATAFDLMGFKEFSRLVVFTGHASETANNPYDSSLDCGACAGNPGGPSARVLAKVCNDEAVRAELRDRGFDIPEDTIFVAGQHNTTTDEVELFVDDVPESHSDDLDQLRTDLTTARENATTERAEAMGADGSTGVTETERRAADWAETRPEWGLAGNAGFVIGPRELTSGCDLDGRAFLHSYDWSTDPNGDALEAILTGPMVVTQWINAQYYFSTVDNAVYGSGSKVTQNPVGNVGVYQGNGGDLMAGLPLQSLMIADREPYHQPLRLSTVVHAPVERITDILADHEELTEILDNNWLSLTVVDPTQDHRVFHYEESLEWMPVSEQTEAHPEMPNAQAVADD
ncbi:DUF2309 domain-containing protein [Halogeometricum borinquense]|uniref:Probable inorganic carbon transporter subunit DabA n=1 Tax=Halogeometricum borinquense TaxID=60847 RepID=A0A482T192_9EURY|nr:DUF2309 domain-containing protein [Halogeometricum borinquense]RYJ07722.1 DUF2309 domain-containing protein [Halogeometricum borinquense]